jgi:hypothetical protein
MCIYLLSLTITFGGAIAVEIVLNNIKNKDFVLNCLQ